MGTDVILITGGSRGIGAATAMAAAQGGYRVAINYLSETELATAIVERIVTAGGVAQAFAADISDSTSVIRLFREIDESLGSVRVLVNNAAISGRRQEFLQIDSRAIERVLNTNILGSFLCAREAVRRMSTDNGGEGGVIINLSSQVARFGGNQLLAYAASKGAIESFTIGLAREVANQGIRVNAVSPGIIATDQHLLRDPDAVHSESVDVPLQRLGTPTEVAEAVLWLASDKAAYITGVVLPVAGGR